VFLYAVAAAEGFDLNFFHDAAWDAYTRRPEAYDALLPGVIPTDFVGRARRALEMHAYHRGTNPTALDDWRAYLDLRVETRAAELLGLPTGLPGLDRLTGGVRGMTFLVGDTGTGKTSLACQIVSEALAARRNLGAVYFSFDMTKTALLDRLCCRAAGISYTALKTGNLTPAEKAGVEAADRYLEEGVLPFLSIREWGPPQWTEPETGKRKPLTADWMADAVTDFKAAAGVTDMLVVVDLLGRMQVGRKEATDQEVDERRLAVLTELRDRFRAGPRAGELTFLVLAEVRKDRRGGRITRDDVRGSVQIPYTADCLLALEVDGGRPHGDGVTRCLLTSLNSTDADSGRSGRRRERGEQQFPHGGGEFVEGRVRTRLWQNGLGPEPPTDRAQGVGEGDGRLAGPRHGTDPLRCG
jgi:hypothetical protein